MKCNMPALYRYTWPGEKERKACVVHAWSTIRIANAIGLNLQVIELSQEEIIENHQCDHEQIKIEGERFENQKNRQHGGND